MDQSRTDHLLAKEIKSLKRSHRLRTRLHISKGHMRLASHLVISQSDDIKDWPIGCKQGIEGKAEIRLWDLFRKIGQVESVIV